MLLCALYCGLLRRRRRQDARLFEAGRADDCLPLHLRVGRRQPYALDGREPRRPLLRADRFGKRSAGPGRHFGRRARRAVLYADALGAVEGVPLLSLCALWRIEHLDPHLRVAECCADAERRLFVTCGRARSGLRRRDGFRTLGDAAGSDPEAGVRLPRPVGIDLEVDRLDDGVDPDRVPYGCGPGRFLYL